jgi:transcriptional regulator with XRE-family HTH domain
VLSETLKRELARYAVGDRIRALRTQKELRLAEVAKRSGISISLLSKIERGQSVPTLLALQSIAAALDVTLPYFFPKPRRPVPAVTRPADRIVLPEFPRGKDSSFDFESLNFSAVEPVLNCYRAHFRRNPKGRPHTHPGSEFLYVLTGSLRITIVKDDYTLDAGDSMYFDSSLSHRYANAGDDACTALVVTFPTLSAAAELDSDGTRDALHLRARRIIWSRTG